MKMLTLYSNPYFDSGAARAAIGAPRQDGGI